MKDHLDVIADKIIQLADDCNYSTPSYNRSVEFKEELKKILLNGLSDLRFAPSTNES